MLAYASQCERVIFQLFRIELQWRSWLRGSPNPKLGPSAQVRIPVPANFFPFVFAPSVFALLIYFAFSLGFFSFFSIENLKTFYDNSLLSKSSLYFLESWNVFRGPNTYTYGQKIAIFGSKWTKISFSWKLFIKSSRINPV